MTGGKTSQFTLSQPPAFRSFPEEKEASGHRAEDQEVVRRLDLGALFRAVAVGHHARSRR